MEKKLNSPELSPTTKIASCKTKAVYDEMEMEPKSVVIDVAKDREECEKINIPGRLLVRGKTVRPPYSNLEEFSLPKEVVKALDAMGIQELSDLHKIISPNFKRGTDLIIIAPDGGQQRGKDVRALSYLLPIIKLVHHNYALMPTPDETEPPETLIVVNSYNSGLGLETFIKSLFGYNKDLPIFVKFLSKHYVPNHPNYEKNLIPGGISILIITVSYLDLVLQTKDGPFLLEKLRFIMFEEVELYLASYWNSIEAFIDAVRQNQYVSTRAVPFQLTFSGSKWSPEIERWYKGMLRNRTPMVAISSPNQALRYSKIKWKVHHASEELRLENLLDVIQSNTASHSRMVVACSTPEIAKIIYDFIQPVIKQQVYMITRNTDSIELAHKMKANWQNRYNNNLLIISDEMIHKLGISNATCLISYDSPIQEPGQRKRPSAAERFAYLWANIRHMEVDSSDAPSFVQPRSEIARPDIYQDDLVAHFLITGNEPNFLELCKFATSLENTEFPVLLRRRAQLMEEEGLRDAPLCQGLKLFGFCNHIPSGSCPVRHAFSRKELSETPSTPYFGELEMYITKCINPSLCQAQLLYHYEYVQDKRVFRTSYVAEAERRKAEMKNFYETESNPSAQYAITCYQPGTWCAIQTTDPETGEQAFERGTLERIVQTDNFGIPSAIRVYCVDTGYTLNPSMDRVYSLPSQFQEWAPLVVNLVVCHLKPCRNEREYRHTTQSRAKNLYEGKVLNGRIWLSIGNTVWVNPLVQYHTNPQTGKTHKGRSMRLVVINDKMADFNGQHLEALMELVNRFPGEYKGITNASMRQLDEIDMARDEFHQVDDRIQWAFVEKSTDTEVRPVKLVSQYGLDPWTFFGVHDKFFKQLKNLESKVHKKTEEYLKGLGKEKRYFRYSGMFENYYKIGMVVAAWEREEKIWMRGLITEDWKDVVEDYRYYTVFFVDYGHTSYGMTTDELFPIHREYVFQLPFQAIAIRLDHVVPLNDNEEWDYAAIMGLLDVIVGDQLSINMQIVAYEDMEYPKELVPCRYYKGLAFYKDIELGDMLVEKRLARWAPGMENFAQSVRNKVEDFLNAARVEWEIAQDDDEEEYGEESHQTLLLAEQAEFDYNCNVTPIVQPRGRARDRVRMRLDFFANVATTYQSQPEQCQDEEKLGSETGEKSTADELTVEEISKIDFSVSPKEVSIMHQMIGKKLSDPIFNIPLSRVEQQQGNENLALDAEQGCNLAVLQQGVVLQNYELKECEGSSQLAAVYEEPKITISAKHLSIMKQLIGQKLSDTFLNPSQPTTEQQKAPLKQPTTEQQKAPPQQPTSIKCYAAPLKKDFLNPPLTWRQTNSSFILTIHLADIKQYELSVWEDKNNIEFKTLDKKPNYGFQIKLFGKVEPELVDSTYLTGMYMRVKFTKRMQGKKWLRALYDRKLKLKWLKEELEELAESEEEEKTDELALVGPKAISNFELGIDDQNDGGYYDDDDMMFQAMSDTDSDEN